MKLVMNRKPLALAHAASLETRLAMARWSGRPAGMPQAAWQRQQQIRVMNWLVQGGLSAD
ncbi:MAG: hypothetical protein K0R43_3858 [Pseudoduganella sp.]|nr:hypothetical protein [Pseudoduganella sp.]